jgi:EpsD family peptidyl-prolyl cis-trans isomerase
MRLPPAWRSFAIALRRARSALLFGLGALLASPTSAQVIADWGTIATPVTSPVTFSFGQYDVTGNFTHQYLFSLEGSADATYSVTFQFDACRNGCGNPVLSYGIQGAGGLSSSPSGTYLLAPGSYAFEVVGTGMGAGNSIDYQGSLTFSLASDAGATSNIVSPVPEPETYALMGFGLLLVAAAVRRRKAREARDPGHAPFGRPLRLGGVAPTVLLLLAMPGALLVAGCTQAPVDRPTQVVAKVGGTEISALQLDLAMKAQRNALLADVDREQTLDKLIDRELAVQQALARKLDREPEVMLRLEELRREVLASTFAERVAAARPKPTAEAVRTFHAQHPELFEQRKIYRLRELVIPASSPRLAEAKERLARRQPLAEIAGWLSREKIRFSQQDVVRAAEQVPLEALRTLHAAGEGQTVIFEAPQALFVYQLLGAQPAPLDLAAAVSFIADHLARQEGERAMRAELKVLRAATNIERVGPPGQRASPATKIGT